MLDEAARVIPQDEVHLARITLKATAGLRLIPEKAAIKILKDIQNLFKKYPFKGHEDVSILDGKYEGIYSWLTLNYALSNLKLNFTFFKINQKTLGHLLFFDSRKLITLPQDIFFIKIQIGKAKYIAFQT